MDTQTDGIPIFACDDMLGGLARWLRAAGYDASWHPRINDTDLVDLARREGRFLLTSDTGIFRHGLVRDLDVKSLLVPHGIKKKAQLAFVLKELSLPLLAHRCMSCGGALVPVPKDQVRDRVPVRSFNWLDEFFECLRCHHVFWPGTHWEKIKATLGQASSSTEKIP